MIVKSRNVSMRVCYVLSSWKIYFKFYFFRRLLKVLPVYIYARMQRSINCNRMRRSIIWHNKTSLWNRDVKLWWVTWCAMWLRLNNYPIIIHVQIHIIALCWYFTSPLDVSKSTGVAALFWNPACRLITFISKFQVSKQSCNFNVRPGYLKV